MNIKKSENNALHLRKANTFCYLLWERAYIDEYGNVFFCCLCRPQPVGNIYKHDLAYIWQKSKKAKLLRAMALNGGLSCYPRCTILSKKDKEVALGRFYRNQGKLTEAEAAFKDVLEADYRNHSIYFELGWLYKDMGKLGDSEASFKKALKLEPRNPNSYVGLGWLYKEEKKYNEARELFKKALKLNPGSFATYAELGWLYKDQGKPNDAEAFFKKALELNPNTESACAGLG